MQFVCRAENTTAGEVSAESSADHSFAGLQDVLMNATLTWFGGVLNVQREQSPLAFEQ